MHDFNSSALRAVSWIFVSLKPSWSIEWVPGQPRLLHREKKEREREREEIGEKKKEDETSYLLTIC